MTEKTPRQFFKPLAIGAPEPFRDLPVQLERMIHFVPGHNEKVRSKTPDMAKKSDVILANLEDAIPADAKLEARAGAIEMAKMVDWKKIGTGLWTRVNPLNSPWFLDDVTEIVTKAGDVYDVIMLPKVEGPWDIHFADQLVAQLEAKAGVKRPILFHAILETAQGVALVDEIAKASPRMQGISLGPADLAANRAMKTTRVGGGHPMYRVIEDPVEGRERVSAQQDLWHYTFAQNGRRLRHRRHQALLWTVRRHLRSRRLRTAVPQRLPHGLRRRVVAAPRPDRHRQARLLARIQPK